MGSGMIATSGRAARVRIVIDAVHLRYRLANRAEVIDSDNRAGGAAAISRHRSRGADLQLMRLASYRDGHRCT